ncbi:hypothetical protein [Deinococcus depolymerans]|uniref:Uncharacterized protein n=1 Tax=Deinococcus depolymerans TaxID=392408 RepID=A0ABN1BRY4_9DEIO
MQPPATLSAALRLIAQAPALWPGFHPQRTPLLTFDGTHTWLHQCAPPPGPGWTAQPDGWSWPGRHPDLNANTALPLGDGRWAAGVLLPSLGEPDARTLAAILIHEAFHAYQHATPSVAWEVSELDALTYPAHPAVLHARAEETHCLRRALHEPDWLTPARQALSWRAQRHALLTVAQRTFETRMETREGLATYVETRFLQQFPALDPAAAPGLGPRRWAYVSGAALAHLLDRRDPHGPSPWPQAALTGQSLADLLLERTGTPLPAAPHADLQAAAREAAATHAAQLQAQLDAFQAQPGPRLHLRGALRVCSFDPMNLHPLPGGDLLHARQLQLRRDGPDHLRAQLGTFGHPARTGGPSLSHVQEVTLRGLPAPTVQGDRWQVRTPSLTVDLPADAVSPDADGWTARWP